MNKKPQDKPADKPSPATSTPTPQKKKLSLDVTDVSEVLERKISP
jgi:hypothetical protein